MEIFNKKVDKRSIREMFVHQRMVKLKMLIYISAEMADKQWLYMFFSAQGQVREK